MARLNGIDAVPPLYILFHSSTYIRSQFLKKVYSSASRRRTSQIRKCPQGQRREVGWDGDRSIEAKLRVRIWAVRAVQ